MNEERPEEGGKKGYNTGPSDGIKKRKTIKKRGLKRRDRRDIIWSPWKRRLERRRGLNTLKLEIAGGTGLRRGLDGYRAKPNVEGKSKAKQGSRSGAKATSTVWIGEFSAGTYFRAMEWWLPY